MIRPVQSLKKKLQDTFFFLIWKPNNPAYLIQEKNLKVNKKNSDSIQNIRGRNKWDFPYNR